MNFGTWTFAFATFIGATAGWYSGLPPMAPPAIRQADPTLDAIRSARGVLYTTQQTPTSLAQVRSTTPVLTR
jgi:hypothetical protein